MSERRRVRRRSSRLPGRQFGPSASGPRRPGLRALLAATAVVGAVCASFGAAFAYADGLPAHHVAHTFPADSLVYARNGQLIADLHPAGRTRIPVALPAIAGVERQAIVAVEDRNFWHEGSIDWLRIGSAAVFDLSHHSTAQGASTITEQLAKMLYLNDRKTFRRKLNELLLGQALSAQQGKRRILDEYLNDAAFGHGATGIEAAARVYFGVPAAKLDLAQAALLAGLPNAPTYLDPYSHLEAAKDRQRQVLDAMASAHEITWRQAAAAAAEKLKLAGGGADDVDLYPYFTMRVVQAVEARVHEDPYTAGLTIRTTLDPGLQQAAIRAVRDRVAALAGAGVSDGAAVSLDPTSGQVLAYVGGAGPGHPGYQIDLAAALRQPGSTFKVLTYTTAIAERKLTMTSRVSDGPLTLPNGGNPYTVHNYDHRHHGDPTVAAALGNSLNIPAVRVELAAGIPGILSLARRLGITSLSGPDAGYGPSLTLGGYPIPLWELAQAYGAIANGGRLHPARFLTSVSDATGRQLLKPAAGGGAVLDPGVAYIMNRILSTDANRAMEFGRGSLLTLPGHRVAAKTGTTNDNRDALTVGWTPHLLTAAWVGNADDRPMRGVIGLTGAAPIWHEIMRTGLGSAADGWPTPPADVYSRWTGGSEAWYLDGTAPGWSVLGGGDQAGSGGPAAGGGHGHGHGLGHGQGG